MTTPPSEPAAVILAADLLKWVIPKVGRFPRQVRYGLGSRIEAAHLDVLESLVVAQGSSAAQRNLEVRGLGWSGSAGDLEANR